MAGGIQPGTVATSEESAESEKNHTQWIREVVRELGPNWMIRKSISIEEIIGKKPEYALLNDDGDSQYWYSDGGFFYRKSENGTWKLVGVAENKWQKNRENACERAFRYLSFLKGSQIFISCSGLGFTKKNGGGATGPTIEMLKFAGSYVIENVNDEESFKAEFRNWVNTLDVV